MKSVKNPAYIILILLIVVIIAIIFSLLPPISPQDKLSDSNDSCDSCTVPNGIMIDGISLDTILSGDIEAFRDVDPREFGRAMDISMYDSDDLNRQAGFMDCAVTTDQSPEAFADLAMNIQTDLVLAMQEANRNTPRYSPGDEIKGDMPDSISLLDKFAYLPAEWDQTGGSPEHCGNCWVWADTGALQMELFRQENISDRLSVQYFTSTYHNGTGIWACCGGSPVWFADFYNITGKAVPLSNNNASFADSATMCENGESTLVPAKTIQTSPNYPIEEMHAEMISTNSAYEEEDISKDDAAGLIKSAIADGRAVVIIYTPDNWDPFMSFWENGNESAVFSPKSTPGATGNDGGHVMLILGYSDTVPDGGYWTVLNSWGAPANRPDGTFRLDMDMDYSMQNPDGVNTFEFYVQNVTWGSISGT
ncbi:C1 family peptidase [Methanoplanus limicola]|uniref:Peptidase C1A papain n=1 Tax=Methanoplanus limicola DSM 2279 TaxID=937775 RepID=H1Z3A4_9EURY|nr:C1 family peptidase [Methanoplanus limicola]EHQ36519.1 peptidase C1A papain [Methanoplanus limicola DSM 2279]